MSDENGMTRSERESKAKAVVEATPGVVPADVSSSPISESVTLAGKEFEPEVLIELLQQEEVERVYGEVTVQTDIGNADW